MTESPHVLRRLLVLAAVAGLLLTPMVIAAQTRTPDLVTIYVGMPSDAAKTALQKRMAQSTLQLDPGGGFTLFTTDPMNRDMVQVFVTAEPNDPAVWMIRRVQNFSAQNPDDESRPADGAP